LKELFEARETYKTSLEQQIKNYKDEFGQDAVISDDIMTSFKQNALDGSRSTLIKICLWLLLMVINIMHYGQKQTNQIII
jgi:hypothetical protein